MRRKIELPRSLVWMFDAPLILMILTGCLVRASTLEVPSSQQLQNLYGKPTMERFAVGPGITLTAEYGADGLVCHLLIAPVRKSSPMPSRAVSKVLEEVVPIASRGKQIHFQILEVGGNKLLNTNYERVTIRRVCSEDSCPSSNANQDIETAVVFNRDACHRPIGQPR